MLFNLFRRTPPKPSREQILERMADFRLEIDKFGGAFDFLATALNLASKDRLYEAGGYLAAERFPFKKAMLLSASLQLINLWWGLVEAGECVEEKTKDVVFQRAYEGWRLGNYILDVEELAHLLSEEKSLDVGPTLSTGQLIERVFESGLIHHLMKDLEEKADKSFWEWTHKEYRSVLKHYLPPIKLWTNV